MAKQATQVRFDETTYEKLKVIAEHELRSINAQIEYYVKTGVEEFERQHPSTLSNLHGV